MKQRGFTLLASLIFLVLLTILGISMFGGFSQNELMSGNMREKARALDSAQILLNDAQSWLVANTYSGGSNWNQGIACASNAAITVAGASKPVICNDALSNATSVPWAGFYMDKTPSGMSVSTTGGVDKYAASPSYYIQYIGISINTPPGGVYKVTATGQGGNSNAVAVVQAVYEVTALSNDLTP